MTQEGPLAQSESLADRLTRRMHRKPWQLIRRDVEHQNHAAHIEFDGLVEELARRPDLVQRPTDVGAAPPQLF
jgi:hypothetical protein